jgi:hypothetical protein
LQQRVTNETRVAANLPAVDQPPLALLVRAVRGAHEARLEVRAAVARKADRADQPVAIDRVHPGLITNEVNNGG